MPNSINIGNAILCDYVSRGENNKHILVGVYSGDVLFVEFPPVSVFGLYLEYLIEGTERTEIKFSIRLNGDLVGEAVAEYEPTDFAQYTVFALQQFPLPTLTTDSTLDVSLSAPGFRTVRALQKHIRKLTQSAFASAIRPPAARSRRARKAKASPP